MQKFRRHVECENDWDTIANPIVENKYKGLLSVPPPFASLDMQGSQNYVEKTPARL